MIVTFPDQLHIAAISWVLDRPAHINSSPYTGARSAAAEPWHGKWSAQIKLAPLVNGNDRRALRAFAGSLLGQVGTFRIPATEGDQQNFPAATVSVTVAKGGTAMTLVGAQLLPGHMITVNDQLLQIVTADDYAITFQPPLRAQATAGTAVETGNPTCLVALSDSAFRWDVEPGPIYSAEFNVEEVF